MTTKVLCETIDDKSFVDVPAAIPAVKFPLPKVGITRRPFYINIQDPFSKEPTLLLSELKIFFSLPATQRGLHMSRIEECLNNMASKSILSLNDWITQLSKTLLAKQQQLDCIIELEMQYEKATTKNPSKILSHEIIKLNTSAIANQNEINIATGITVPFINACPCTQRWGMREFYKKLINLGYDHSEAEKLIVIAPLQAHTNLGKASLKIWNNHITHSQIYDLLDNSLPIVRELLKGPDEHDLVQKAHQEGQFCEDNIRSIISEVCSKLENVIENADKVEIIVEVEESVHSHNLYAEITSTFGELKDNLEIP